MDQFDITRDEDSFKEYISSVVRLVEDAVKYDPEIMYFVGLASIENSVKDVEGILNDTN